MKQQINEIKRMQRIAGLITESEYQKSLTHEESVENWNEIAVSNHENALEKELGDEGYKNANVGWGVDENSLTVSSKIYPYDGNSERVFKTEHDKFGNIIDSELIEY